MRDIPGPLPLAVGLIVLAIVFSVLERVGRSLPSKPLLRRERLTDLGWWFFTPWVSRAASTVAVFLAVALLTLLVRAVGWNEPSPAWFERQPLALQIVEMLVLADLHGRMLWPFHET